MGTKCAYEVEAFLRPQTYHGVRWLLFCIIGLMTLVWRLLSNWLELTRSMSFTGIKNSDGFADGGWQEIHVKLGAWACESRLMRLSLPVANITGTWCQCKFKLAEPRCICNCLHFLGAALSLLDGCLVAYRQQIKKASWYSSQTGRGELYSLWFRTMLLLDQLSTQGRDSIKSRKTSQKMPLNQDSTET